MSFIGDIFGGGDDAADAPIQASEIQAEYQREALDYLKETEELPLELREGALRKLAGVSGLEGGEGTQEEMVASAVDSPLYQAIMGGQEAGEESIMRQASATGGLRSGNVQDALYDYNVQLENRALLESYNQQMAGLQGLANLPSLAPVVAQGTGAIGQTLAQGQIASAQAQQASSQQGMGNMMGLGQLGISAYDSGMFSDRRLKKNIKKISRHNGWNIYSWDWNIIANELGLDGSAFGCMADEVFAETPGAVIVKDNFLWVQYNKIGILQ